MKILVIQLTRLGDIFLTYPALNCLLRTRGDLEIHLLVREKFLSACVGLDSRVKIHTLNSQKIFAPLIFGDGKAVSAQVDGAVKELDLQLQELRGIQFDRIYNLSFSLSSSWISYDLYLRCKRSNGVQVFGYTRTEDGYLSIPDDLSAYFYAQVGPGRSNRFHLAEILATQMGLDLSEQDWFWPKNHVEKRFSSGLPVLAVQVGASQHAKAIRPEIWANLISTSFVREGFEVILLGGLEDVSYARQICSSTTHPRLQNLTGNHSFIEVAEWIRSSRVLIAPDSCLVHLASLVGTPTLQITHSATKFWETGPRADGSFVLEFLSPEQVSSSQILLGLNRMLDPKSSINNQAFENCRYFKRIESTPSYQWIAGVPLSSESEFAWDLTRAIYQGEKLPEVLVTRRAEALLNLIEVNSLVIDLLRRSKTPLVLKNFAPILAQTEEVIQALSSMCAEIGPLISWYQTQKVRIGPGDFSAIREQTLKIHQDLGKFLNLFAGDDRVETDASSHAIGG